MSDVVLLDNCLNLCDHVQHRRHVQATTKGWFDFCGVRGLKMPYGASLESQRSMKQHSASEE
jgi:hypothetical protein